MQASLGGVFGKVAVKRHKSLALCALCAMQGICKVKPLGVGIQHALCQYSVGSTDVLQIQEVAKTGFNRFGLQRIAGVARRRWCQVQPSACAPVVCLGQHCGVHFFDAVPRARVGNAAADGDQTGRQGRFLPGRNRREQYAFWCFSELKPRTRLPVARLAQGLEKRGRYPFSKPSPYQRSQSCR